jgi:mRNA interferase RelE/StbE
MAYTIELARRAQKQLVKIPFDSRRRIAALIDALAENPRPAGAGKMQGVENTYRLRVGDYRILYEIQDRRLIVYVLRIGHRREVYR